MHDYCWILGGPPGCFVSCLEWKCNECLDEPPYLALGRRSCRSGDLPNLDRGRLDLRAVHWYDEHMTSRGAQKPRWKQLDPFGRMGRGQVDGEPVLVLPARRTCKCETCGGTGIVEVNDREALKAARERAGLSLRELSRRSGVAVSLLSDFEAGRRGQNSEAVLRAVLKHGKTRWREESMRDLLEALAIRGQELMEMGCWVDDETGDFQVYLSGDIDPDEPLLAEKVLAAHILAKAQEAAEIKVAAQR